MKKYTLVSIILTLATASFFSSFIYTIQAKQLAPKTIKKKIIIFTSKGGGGHTSASNALTAYLKDTYEVNVVNMFDEVLAPVDSVRTLSLGAFTGEDFYNYCLQNRWTNILNSFGDIGAWGIRYKQTNIERLITDYLAAKKPDLVISVIPYINFTLLPAVKKLSLPFILIPTDLDGTTFVHGIHNPQYDKFKLALSFYDNDIFCKIRHACINPKNITVIGFPLKPEFFTPKDPFALREEFKLPFNKPVVMLLMGAAGSSSSYRYIRHIARLNFAVHVVVCLGRNEGLRRKINKVILPDHITLSTIGFTDRIADLMAACDVIITKSGTVSVCEALQLTRPMILDGTSDSLRWEDFNLNFIEKHMFGTVLYNFKDLSTMLYRYVANQNYMRLLKKSIATFKKNNFGENIKHLVAEMIN